MAENRGVCGDGGRGTVVCGSAASESTRRQHFRNAAGPGREALAGLYTEPGRDQGTKSETKTDKAGKYSFTGLKAGTYKISVILPLQKDPYLAGQVKVSTGQSVPADINLLELVAKKIRIMWRPQEAG